MYTPPYQITSEILHLVAEISEQVGALNERLGDNVPSPILRKDNQIKTIHSSLVIEHNSLSLSQVTDVINGKHVQGAPNEIQEVKNALQAYQLMFQLDAHKEEDLLKAHALMMHDLMEHAGRYRNTGVGVFDGDICIHMAPGADRVPFLMKDLFEWVAHTDDHPLISICVFHYEFEFIHPFLDGNGRMGRYWQTMLLSRWKGVFAWIPVETIVKANQQEYYKAIAESDSKGDSTDFIVFMLKCLLKAIHKEVSDKVSDKSYTVSEQRIIDLLKDDCYLAVIQLCEKSGLSEGGVKKVLTALKRKDAIERVGSNKNGYWNVK